jgi:predicted amidohydrolase YtcJ
MKRSFALLTFLLLLVLFLNPAAGAAIRADVVYVNGNIYTVDEKNPKASAVAIKDGRFVYVGSDGTARKYIGERTTVYDLMGRTVLPGLIDSHLHFQAVGELKMKLDLFWKPKGEIVDLVAGEYKKVKGEWIEGFGWNQEVWDPPVFPTKEDLDRVAPDAPVYLARTDGHAVWVNSKALELAGITRDTPNPAGGEIIKDAGGNPTGILIDTAEGAVTRKIPPLAKEKMLRALLLAQEELFSSGVTSAQDAATDPGMIDLLKGLYQSGKLAIRLYGRLVVPENRLTPGDEFYSRGKEVGLFEDRLTVRGVKAFVDGALGSWGALMLKPYRDRSDGYLGNQRITEERLHAVVRRAREAGFQVSAHAIGDAANRMVLDVYEKVLKERPDPPHRYRIEHAQVVALDDIPRFTMLGVIPSMQTVHATSDKNMAEKRLGPERIKGAYAWRKFLASGSIIANGTDAPVELVNPFHGLYAAVTRQDRDGKPEGGWYPEERMTREEALKSYTLWAAYAAFEEKIKGSIQPGKLADFVVIDRDYMNCSAREIKDIRPLQTILGGKVVYPVKQTSR